MHSLSAMNPTPEASVQLETLKLLVSVAWADHSVAPAERAHILELAASFGASPMEIEALQDALLDEGHLPAADLTLLSERPADVLAALDVLIASDKRIAENEVAAREAIARLLST